MSWLFSLVQVAQYCDSVDPIWCNWFLNSVLPILRRESVSAVSLPMYLDCRFFLDCFMCCEVIVLSLIFDLQFAGEWISFAVIFFVVKICNSRAFFNACHKWCYIILILFILWHVHGGDGIIVFVVSNITAVTRLWLYPLLVSNSEKWNILTSLILSLFFVFH